MIQQTPSNSHESCIPDTYNQILEARPHVRSHGHEDKICDFIACLACSPIIIPMWVFCCIGVTAKKTKNTCFNFSVSTKVENSVTVITEQPK